MSTPEMDGSREALDWGNGVTTPISTPTPDDHGRGVALTHVLWARSERYGTPFVLSAWADAFRDTFPEMFWEEVAQAKAFLLQQDPSDGPWEFTLVATEMTAPLALESEPAGFEKSIGRVR